MPPRIFRPSAAITSSLRCKPLRPRYYSTATDSAHPQSCAAPLARYPLTQPPSHKPPEFRKSQLLRQYASLLRSTPLMLLFQHNNLKASEWVAVRRELVFALRKVDEARFAAGSSRVDNLADSMRLLTLQTGIFGAALRVVEYYKPELQASSGDGLTHTLSKAAHEAAVQRMTTHELSPLLSGPLCVLTFPIVSPQHLGTAISILSPSPPQFPAPKKKLNPGWHDPAVQAGIQKLLLLGARVEGKVFDIEGAKWVGGIDGGIDTLRVKLIAMLQGIGAGLTHTLESSGRSLYFTVEGRQAMLEDEHKHTPGETETI